jgi:two-component system, cell cycle sensor histidine kinase and response regulator CckA
MHVARPGSRALADLILALAIGVFLLALNVSINYAQDLERFFSEYSNYPLATLLVNLVFLWLVLLLAVAFRRWRISAAKQAELEDVISSISPDVLLMVTPEREIVMCNGSVTRVFGYAPKELLHQTTEVLYCDRRSSANRPHEIYDALERDGFHVGEAKGRRRNGDLFPLEIISAELRRRRGAVLLLRDTTERMRAERQRLALERRVREQERMESLGQMAGGVAHDFKNILTVIQGNAEMLTESVPSGTAEREKLNGILEATGRAAGLCRRMAAYAGKGEIAQQPLELSEPVRKVCRVAKDALKTNVKLELNLAPDLPSIKAEPVQMEQIVMNLILNGAEAIGANEGVVKVTTAVRDCTEADLSGSVIAHNVPAGRCVCLEVEDSGCGMDENTIPKIFDPWFSTKGVGRGWGLPSVLAIVRDHGGALLVRSSVGAGTTLTVVLPIQ